MDDAITRATEIVHATEWSGDMRVNMTTIIGAGRVLAKRVRELESLITKGVCNFATPCGNCEQCEATRKAMERQ